MLLPTAEFLLSLALELICKACYLKLNLGPCDAIYRHQVVDLLGPSFFNTEQRRLMLHAQRFVIWAGRYPTPKWIKESQKEDYDVPSVFTGSQEVIDARDLPNGASRPRCDELLALYDHIHQEWAK